MKTPIPPRSRTRRRAVFGLLLVGSAASALLGAPRAALAQTTTASWLVGARSYARLGGGGLELDARYRFASGLQLGGYAETALFERTYVAGSPVDGVVAPEGGVVFLAPLVVNERAELALRARIGVARLHELDGNVAALRIQQEYGAFAHVRVSENGLFRAGVLVGLDLEAEPAFDLADQWQGISLGYGHALSEHVFLYAEALGGGTFGFDGDNAKAILEGSLGIRIPLAGGRHGAF